jgi:hypothetical protein
VLLAVGSTSSAATAADTHAQRAALQKARPAVSRAARHPGLLQTEGYCNVLVMDVNDAAANGSPASSRRAALHGGPQIHHRLISELKQTTHQMGQGGEPTC